MDFLQEAVGAAEAVQDALVRANNACGETAANRAFATMERMQSVTTMLALLSLAADVRRVADVLVAVTSGGDSIAVRGDPAQ